MDIFMLLGAMLLAYGGIIFVYYRVHANERKNRISNLMLKGTMSMRRGNLERALIYFNKAYEYSADNDSISKAADALYNMGHVYKEIGDINTAMECWDESDSLYMEVNDIKGNKRIRTALKPIKGQFTDSFS